MIDLSNEFAIGIDIGGTNTKYGIVNHRGDIVEKGELRTDAFPEIDDYINALYETLSPILKVHADEGKMKGIGIGAPNGNFYTGLSIMHPIYTGKGSFL
jgi:glucokinase